MRYLSLLLSLVALLLLAACQPNANPDPKEPETGPTATAPMPVEATDSEPQATPTPENYPAAPQPTQSLDGYPAAPDAQAPPTGYPDDMVVWVMRPLGQQCVDPETYEYADLDAAVEALEEAGVQVSASETMELGVCEACDCPTSEHFRVQIQASDLEQAESLGWTRGE